MTLTLAALSSAELIVRYASAASADFFSPTSDRNLFSNVWRRDLMDLLWLCLRRLARACLAADLVRGMAEISCVLNGAPSYRPTSDCQRGKLYDSPCFFSTSGI